MKSDEEQVPSQEQESNQEIKITEGKISQEENIPELELEDIKINEIEEEPKETMGILLEEENIDTHHGNVEEPSQLKHKKRKDRKKNLMIKKMKKKKKLNKKNI